MPEYSDKDLLQMFREDDKSNYAFNLIIRKYQERVYWHIRKILLNHEDTNDVLQNTFIKVWKGLSSFREESQLYTWLFRIATNESLSFLKKRRTRLFIPIDVQDQMINNLKSDAYFDGGEMEIEFQKALLDLPAKQRIVFNMKYFDDMKYEEISGVLNTSVGALKASYHHAVKKIRKYLEEN
ncbi:RNA polymerase sigma factor [Bacteroidota bacterium]